RRRPRRVALSVARSHGRRCSDDAWLATAPWELLHGLGRCWSGMVRLDGPDWEEVKAMAMEMWVSLGGLLVAVLALHASLSRPIRRLDSAIGELRSELKGDLGALRSELKADIAGLDERLSSVEEHLTGVDARVIRLDERVARLDDRVVGVDTRVARLDDRVAGLDDRVYALAVGLRPQLHQREGSESGGAAGSTG